MVICVSHLRAKNKRKWIFLFGSIFVKRRESAVLLCYSENIESFIGDKNRVWKSNKLKIGKYK